MNQVTVCNRNGEFVMDWRLTVAYESSLLSLLWESLGDCISSGTKLIWETMFTRYVGKWQEYYVKTSEVEHCLSAQAQN